MIPANTRRLVFICTTLTPAGLCKPKDKVLSRKPATSPETAQGVPAHPPQGAKGAQCSRSGELPGRHVTFHFIYVMSLWWLGNDGVDLLSSFQQLREGVAGLSSGLHLHHLLHCRHGGKNPGWGTSRPVGGDQERCTAFISAPRR